MHRETERERQIERDRPERPHLSMVGAAVLGHGALAVHEEAVAAALLGQRRLVALGDEGVQLTLLAADGLHKLPPQRHRENGVTQTGGTARGEGAEERQTIFPKTMFVQMSHLYPGLITA